MTDDNSADANASDNLTPEEAQAELDALALDSDFQDKLFSQHHPAHAEAVAKQAALFDIVYGDDADAQSDDSASESTSMFEEAREQDQSDEAVERALDQFADPSLTGAPTDDPSEFQLEAVADHRFDETLREEAAGWMHEIGLSPEQGRSVMVEIGSLETLPAPEDVEAERDTAEQELRAELGDAVFERAIAEAREYIASIDPDGELRDFLSKTGLGNNPTVVRAAISAARRAKHGDVLPGSIPF